MSIEKLKLKAELLRVQSAHAEMELHVEERKVEIKRLENNMIIQEEKIKELQTKIQGENK
jgi:chaperonin cofactor prefoldin